MRLENVDLYNVMLTWGVKPVIYEVLRFFYVGDDMAPWSSQCETLCDSVCAICKKSGFDNFRLVEHSNGCLFVYDCPHWSSLASRHLQLKHPNVLVSIKSSTSSLSGFVIVIEESNKREMWNGLICASALTVSYVVLNEYFDFFSLISNFMKTWDFS